MAEQAAVIEAEQAVEKVRRAADLLSKVMDLSKRSRILGLWENCRRVREDLGDVVTVLTAMAREQEETVQTEASQTETVQAEDNGGTLF